MHLEVIANRRSDAGDRGASVNAERNIRESGASGRERIVTAGVRGSLPRLLRCKTEDKRIRDPTLLALYLASIG